MRDQANRLVVLRLFEYETSCLQEVQKFILLKWKMFCLFSGSKRLLFYSIFFSLSDVASNGPGDKPEPSAHALCHRLWFLWQPKNKRHVLSVL